MQFGSHSRAMRPGETTMIEIRPRVAVIGAGIAGLTAASILIDRGYPVHVFEKSRGPGGRTSTRREGDFAFDHGCQYFTVRDDRFRSHVGPWIEQGLVTSWNARFASCGGGAIQMLQDDTMRLVAVPGMNAVAKKLAEDLDVSLGARVIEIVPAKGGWSLLTEPAGAADVFEIVIVATPADQAVPLLQPFPSLQAAAATVRMLPCWAVMAAFDYDIDLPFDATFFRGSPLVWAANNSTKPGRTASESWVLHAGPSWSREHLENEPEAVADALLRAFFDATGRKPVPTVLTKAHRWRFASPENALDTGCLWDAARGLGACGDWCEAPRVEGAFLSGLKVAERIIAERPRAKLAV